MSLTSSYEYYNDASHVPVRNPLMLTAEEREEQAWHAAGVPAINREMERRVSAAWDRWIVKHPETP